MAIYKIFKIGLVTFWCFVFWDYNIEKFRVIYERYSNSRKKRLKLLIINWPTMYILASWTSLYKTVELLGIYWQFSFPLNFFSCKFHVAFSKFYLMLQSYYTQRVSILGICVRSSLSSGKFFFEVVTALVALVFLLYFIGMFKTKLFNRNQDGSILYWVFFLRNSVSGTLW